MVLKVVKLWNFSDSTINDKSCPITLPVFFRSFLSDLISIIVLLRYVIWYKIAFRISFHCFHFFFSVMSAFSNQSYCLIHQIVRANNFQFSSPANFCVRTAMQYKQILYIVVLQNWIHIGVITPGTMSTDRDHMFELLFKSNYNPANICCGTLQ